MIGPYAQSKLAVTTLTAGLATDFQSDGILLRSVCPGPNRTQMTAGPGMFRALVWLRPLFFSQPDAGAKLILDAAVREDLGDRAGIYLSKGKVRRLPPAAANPAIQDRLIELLSLIHI